MKVKLTHPSKKDIYAPTGFNLGCLLFGSFVPLVRGEVKIFIFNLIPNVLLTLLWNLLLAAGYNRRYILRRLDEGYSVETGQDFPSWLAEKAVSPIAKEPVLAPKSEPQKTDVVKTTDKPSVENKGGGKSTYKITPLEKKSIIQTTTYKTGDPAHRREGDKMATREVTFRWGYAVVEADGDDLPKDGDIIVTDYSVIENAYEEEVAVVWEFSDNVSEEERETIESESSENFGDDWLEEIGWHNFDHEDKILEPFKIEEQ